MITRNCRNCGNEFSFERPKGAGRLRILCDTCRNKQGFIGRTHTCNERCDAIAAMISLDTEGTERYTLQRIADEIGVTRQRVDQILQSHGWKLKIHTKPRMPFRCPQCGEMLPDQLSETRKEHHRTLVHERAHAAKMQAHYESMTDWERGNLIVALYDSGIHRMREIADIVEVTLPTVYRWIIRSDRDPYIEGHGPYEKMSHRLTPERDAKIAMDWMAGVPTERIMRNYNVKQRNLSRILKKQGAKRPQWYKDLHMARMRQMSGERRRRGPE